MLNIIEAVDQRYEKQGVKKRIAGNKLSCEGWKGERIQNKRREWSYLDSTRNN